MSVILSAIDSRFSKKKKQIFQTPRKYIKIENKTRVLSIPKISPFFENE